MAKTLSILANKRKKALTVLFIALSVASFATLKPDGKPRQAKYDQTRLLSIRPQLNVQQRFTLRSGFTYTSDRLLTTQQPFQLMSNTVTYEKGNTTYIIPLKKQSVIMQKVKFNPY
jgi:hypothetical protein